MGDRADIEGKLRDGHEVSSSMGESDRGYAKGSKAGGGAEVAMDKLCPYVAMVDMGVDREWGEVLDFVVGACSEEAGRGIRWSGFISLSGYFASMFA